MKNSNDNNSLEKEQDFYDNNHEVPPNDSDYGSDFSPVPESESEKDK